MIYYFIPQKKKPDTSVISGRMLVPAEFEIDLNEGGQQGSDQPSPKPKPKIPKFDPHFEVKWVLPPENSNGYGWTKAAAENAGYETVEHDDMDSYFP